LVFQFEGKKQTRRDKDDSSDDEQVFDQANVALQNMNRDQLKEITKKVNTHTRWTNFKKSMFLNFFAFILFVSIFWRHNSHLQCFF
jgi:hypothetical protein